jgi:hypothetical protein
MTDTDYELLGLRYAASYCRMAFAMVPGQADPCAGQPGELWELIEAAAGDAVNLGKAVAATRDIDRTAAGWQPALVEVMLEYRTLAEGQGDG